MTGLSPLVWLISLLALIVLLFLYGQARLRAGSYRRGKKKFANLNEHLQKLRETILSESDRWPMYARPVLFTDIDRDAQIEFARAQQALADAEQILPEIETIEEPELAEHFRLLDFFNIAKNLRTIYLGNQMSGNVSALEELILRLQHTQRSLRMSRQQVEEKRLAVEKSIEGLRIRTEQINKRLKPLDVWRSIEAHNFTWVINIAERCELEASARLMTSSEDDQGYIEHATADIFVKIGNFSLDCIELFLESQKISRRYDLDTFFKYFDESTGFLQSILQMEEVWSGWKKLKQVKPYIEALPTTRQQAERSLRSFTNRQEYFEKLIDRISVIDIEREVNIVDALEKEGTYYWYPYTERKTFWEKALGNPTVFPSQELERFRALLVGEIHPAIHVDAVIKQSQLMSLIQKVGQAVVWHDTITKLALQLGTALNLHKEAQQKVNRLLATQGEAARLSARVELALLDTSPELREAGTRLVSEYQDYMEQAQRIRGVDFPELLNSLTQWITDSGRLVKQHEVQFEELKARYATYHTRIGALIKEIGVYMNHIPPFDARSMRSFDEMFDEAIAILGEQKIERYSWLSPAVSRMQAWLEKSDPVVAAARDKYTAFENENRLVGELLEQTEAEINRNRDQVDLKWNWSRSEILPRIDSLARAFAREKNHWERLTERNWAEYTIDRAVSTCENLITFCEGLLLDLAQTMENVNQKQSQLDDKAGAVLLLLDQNGSRLSTSDRIDIRSLVGIAKETPDYELADRVLGYAEVMALNRANIQTRNEIRNILYSYQAAEDDEVDRSGG
ncbi:MAG TPA: hypothetical protein VFY25_14920 [Anaerolineales bacterium]|nr:hypothetical protein [Anaerolineales bacterium]